MTALFAGTRGPVPAGTRITQPFGYDPTYPGNSEHVHRGADFGVYYVATTAPCTFVCDLAGEWERTGYGNVVRGYYDDPDGTRWWLLWAHLSEVWVRPGQVIAQGATVGVTGNTGYSTGAHLHFARGRNGHDNAHWEDPLPWLETEEDELAGFTDEEKGALHELAALHLGGRTFAPGTPGRSALIGIMDTYRDLPDDSARRRFDRRARELIIALGLSQDELAALPVPKYETLKRHTVDLQERAQEA